MGNSPANARVHFFHGHQLPFVPPKRRNSWSVLLVVNPATGFRPARQAPPLALRKIRKRMRRLGRGNHIVIGSAQSRGEIVRTLRSARICYQSIHYFRDGKVRHQ